MAATMYDCLRIRSSPRVKARGDSVTAGMCTRFRQRLSSVGPPALQPDFITDPSHPGQLRQRMIVNSCELLRYASEPNQAVITLVARHVGPRLSSRHASG
jgi:hypothetical protein